MRSIWEFIQESSEMIYVIFFFVIFFLAMGMIDQNHKFRLLRAECVEAGIAHYDSMGNFQLNKK